MFSLNPVNSVEPQMTVMKIEDYLDNTERSHGRKIAERVTTEARASGEIRGGNGSPAWSNLSGRVPGTCQLAGEDIVWSVG